MPVRYAFDPLGQDGLKLPCPTSPACRHAGLFRRVYWCCQYPVADIIAFEPPPTHLKLLYRHLSANVTVDRIWVIPCTVGITNCQTAARYVSDATTNQKPSLNGQRSVSPLRSKHLPPSVPLLGSRSELSLRGAFYLPLGVSALAVSRDNMRIIAGDIRGRLYLLNLLNGEVQFLAAFASSNSVDAIAIIDQYKILAFAGSGEIRLDLNSPVSSGTSA